MRIAIPLAQGVLSMHFGHCEEFALIDANDDTKEIEKVEKHGSPPHQPGLLPKWLAEKGADVIVACGMGMRAQGLFAESGINVVIGAPSEPPEEVARKLLDGSLETGSNICDH